MPRKRAQLAVAAVRLFLGYRVRGLWYGANERTCVGYQRGRVLLMGLLGRDRINLRPLYPFYLIHRPPYDKNRHVPGLPGKPARRGRLPVGSGCSSWQRLFLQMSTGGRRLFCLETRWGKERESSAITEQIPSVRPCGRLRDGVVAPTHVQSRRHRSGRGHSHTGTAARLVGGGRFC